MDGTIWAIEEYPHLHQALAVSLVDALPHLDVPRHKTPKNDIPEQMATALMDTITDDELKALRRLTRNNDPEGAIETPEQRDFFLSTLKGILQRRDLSTSPVLTSLAAQVDEALAEKQANTQVTSVTREGELSGAIIHRSSASR